HFQDTSIDNIFNPPTFLESIEFPHRQRTPDLLHRTRRSSATFLSSAILLAKNAHDLAIKRFYYL
ncbi:hypothetical protein CHS0354_013179, partial [Potamilus streckersoni]